MVKEREEIDHGQDERERERIRRRKKFRRGLAIAFSIALLLLAVGAIGYFLFQIPLNVWLWALAGILALILTLGIVRISGVGGLIVLVLLLAGIGTFGYFNNWFCSLGFSAICKNITDPEGDERVVSGPPPSVRADNFGESCFSDQQEDSFCIRVKYVTPRALKYITNPETAESEPVFSTEKSEKLSFGFGDIALPKKFAKRDSDGNPIVVPKYSEDSPEGVLEKIDRNNSLRKSAEKGNRVGLTTLSAVNGASDEDEKAAFLASLNNEINANPNKSVLLYIHGFNQTFDQAVV